MMTQPDVSRPDQTEEDRPSGAARGLDRRTFLRSAAVAGGALAVGGPLSACVSGASAAAGAPVAGAGAGASAVEAGGATAEAGGAAAGAGGVRSPGVTPFELEEVTVAGLQEGMRGGKWTARQLAQLYLDRIDSVDGSGPTLRAVIERNPDALAIADARDAERKAGKVRGPLHGVPIMIKDNIDTGDRMLTTAGSLALVGAPAPDDSFLVKRLRDAGAVLIGKTNLSEWANFRGNQSSSGWSGRGGQCRNPNVLDRSPCGSSSGSGAAVSANLCAIAIGTETDGSVVCPSTANGVVGIKPTLGLVSRDGIVPISHSQDTAGPMARTVADAAALLTVMAGVDPSDRATAAAKGHIAEDYTRFLDAGALKGARLGALGGSFTGYSPEGDRLYEAALAALRDAGATVIDKLEMPHDGDYNDAEFTVLLYEFKHDLNAYLATRTGVPIRTLADAIAFNNDHADEELKWFGQETFIRAQEKGGLDEQEYRDALEKSKRMAGPEGIDALIAEHQLDAIICPTDSPSWAIDLVNGDHFLGGSSTPAAVAGYPHVTVPMGYVFDLPVGLSFFAGAWTEPKLIGLAHAFEQATHHRRPPAMVPTLER